MARGSGARGGRGRVAGGQARGPARAAAGRREGTRYGRPSVPVGRQARRARPPRYLEAATRWMWAGLGVVAAALIAVAVAETPKPAPPKLPVNLTPTIDGVPCLKSATITYRARVHLDLFVRGRRFLLPADIGVFDRPPWNCLYALQTHDTSGVVSIQAPRPATYTLGQFFDIWGMPLSPTVLLGYQATTGPRPASVRAYVDGRLWPGNPRAIPLRNGSAIALEYGPPWVRPAAAYAFPKGS